MSSHKTISIYIQYSNTNRSTSALPTNTWPRRQDHLQVTEEVNVMLFQSICRQTSVRQESIRNLDFDMTSDMMRPVSSQNMVAICYNIF